MDRNEAIRLAEETAGMSTKEVGRSGTVISGGSIEGIEFNAKLASEQWLGETGTVGIVQKMRLTNPQIQAMSLAIKLPIIGAEWVIKEADWESVDDLNESTAKEHARTVRRGMFESPERDWRDTLREGMLFIDYGFFLFEKVWEIADDGTYVIKKFAPRLPQTVTGWLTKDGDFAGVEQMFYDAEANTYRTEEIDAENLILLSHNREGDNFAGVSLYRPIWAISQIKEVLLKLLSIAHERETLGIPVGKRPESGSTKGQDDDVAKLLKNLRGHQKQYGILPFGWEIEWFFNEGGTGAREAILSALRYLDEQTLNAGLTQFIGLGSTASGSRAVAKEHTDLFWMAENGTARAIATPFNGVGRSHQSGVVRQLVFLNHGESPAYPYLEASGIEAKNVMDFAEAIAKVGDKLTKDDVMEEYIRTFFGIPPRNPEELALEKKRREEAPTPPAPGGEQVKDGEPGEGEDQIPGATEKGAKDGVPDVKAVEFAEHGAFAFVPRRAPRGNEVHVNFAEINLRLDTAGEDLESEVFGAIAGAYGRVQKRMDRAIAEQDLAKIPKSLPGLEEELLELFEAEIEASKKFGEITVKQERKRQNIKRTDIVRTQVRRFLDSSTAASMEDWDRRFADEKEESARALVADYEARLLIRDEALAAQAAIIADETASRVVSRMRVEGMGALKRGEKGLFFDSILPGRNEIKRQSMGMSATAFNLGRDQVASNFADEIRNVEFSNLGDARVCGPCASAEMGGPWPYGSAGHMDRECPYGGCDGGMLCRCILIYNFAPTF